MQPRPLLLDEPTANLDRLGMAMLLRTLAGLDCALVMATMTLTPGLSVALGRLS